MRYLIALIGALILLAALAPMASAYNVSLPNWYELQTVTAPTSAQAFCPSIGLANLTGVSDPQERLFVGHDGTYGGPAACTIGSGQPCSIQIPTHTPHYPTVDYTGFWAYYCTGGSYYRNIGIDEFHYIFENITLMNVTANFTATPTQGTGPVYVSFTDTSTGYPSSWNWSITPASGWWASPTDLDNEDLTIYFTDNGNYTISHGVSNAYSSDIETKTDYIWIFNSSATVTTGVTAQDMYSGYPVQGAQVNLLDVENSSWSNTTTGANGKGEITTLMHHTINAYASAGGYGDNEALGLDADGSGYIVVLTPSGFANVTAGSVTAYVTVVDDDGSFRIPEARVDVSYGGASYSIQTNAAGVASFVVPNQTNVLVHARKAGYTGASKSFNSGTGSGGDAHVDVEVRLAKTTYTPTITATTLPGGGLPTTAQTVDPYPCDADHPENCQRKQTEMANILVAWGPDLVLFFIVLTLIGGAKMIGK